jgi:hypothetical protein
MSSGKRGSPDGDLSTGQLRRQVVLESEAVYRVCDLGPLLVEVEVVRAPGLQTGDRYHFTPAAVRAMEAIGEEAEE